MTLDNPELIEAELAQDDAPVEVAPVETEQPEPESELSITIEGEEPPEDDLALDPEEEANLGDKGRKTVKHLRKLAEERAKEARELKARLAQIEAERAPRVEPPKKPTLAECGFDEDEFLRQSVAYAEAQIAAKAESEKIEAAAKAQEEDYKARHARYVEGKSSLRVEGFDDAESTVKDMLSREQQSIIIRNVADPAMVVYALGRAPKKLAELAAVKDLDRFAFRLAQIQGEIKVTQKAPPPAETKLRGGNGASPAMNASNLEKLRAQAERSGDYSDYLAAKRALRESGVKV